MERFHLFLSASLNQKSLPLKEESLSRSLSLSLSLSLFLSLNGKSLSLYEDITLKGESLFFSLAPSHSHSLAQWRECLSLSLYIYIYQ